MDYEKAYKEALERAREFQKSKDGLCVLTTESIFPELKESEDEKIRKALVGFHKSTIDVDGIKGEEIVAWLEKQGEQKPIWSKEDEIGFNDTFWAIQQARTIAKDENDMGNLWYAEDWLKSLKERLS